ncbi:MAG: trypsin-like peptidase domain-containing protein [Clostridium sp.]|nr:trypsin-like peptidase domain-containing protein [Clostridium sp.]MCM1398030.1 trypsin-like peptidase domain-containing protein [Clostridium sp.]MCM1459334.1 trypsin-like peptidase domain-containing protein [Bacteroides sp.]
MGKKGSFIKKSASLIAGAAVFGMVAGATFNLVADVDGSDRGNKVEISKLFDESASAFSYKENKEEIENADKKSDDDIPTTSLVSSKVTSGMDVSDIATSVMPSVVSINVTVMTQYDSFFYGGYEYETPGSGSGIIIGKNDSELLIVTNNHVVEDAKTVSVCFIDENSYDAVVKSTDSDNDLAIVVVKLGDISEETMSKIEIAKLGDSDAVLVGEQVVAIGNALGYGQSVTTGIISAKDRVVDTNTTPLIQTDAAINPGNSGGALLNMQGEVIGINSSKYMSTEVEGMGYAIPISKVDSIISDLMNRRTREKIEDESKRGYLGIECDTVSEEATMLYEIPAGVLVTNVTDGSAADRAGIKANDIITEFDGQAVTSANSLVELLQYYKAGEKIEVKLQTKSVGGYKEKTVTVKLGSRSEITQQ